MSIRVRATNRSRYATRWPALLLTLAVIASACTGDNDDVVTVDTTADESEEDAVVEGSGEEASTSSGERGESSGSAGGDSSSPSAEEEARAALDGLLTGLAAANFTSASRFVLNEGISPEVLRQLGITERQAYDPGALDKALADYCAAVDCTAEVAVGPVVRSDEFSVTIAITVDRPDVDRTLEIPLTSFEGRFTVGLLPFGSPPSPAPDRSGRGSGRAGSTTRPSADDDVPVYPGELADDGWRLAPVAPRDPAVTLWTADEVVNSGHTPTYSVVASGDFGELAYLSHGVVFQKPVSPDSSGSVDDTVWIEVDGGSTPLVESPDDDDLTLLEGARFVDWGEDVVYYQVRSGTDPEDTKSRLYGKNTVTGEATEIAVVGGWESGVDFHDVNASYPLVAGMWRAEGFVGPVILNFETGSFEYHADEVGDSCFAGESGCADYTVVTMIDRSLYGVRSTDSATDSPTSQSLYRFDPSTGTETEVARFGWLDGLWYPRSIMAVGRSVVISVQGSDGEALPAVVVDLDSGDASTLSRPGFVAQSYLT